MTFRKFMRLVSHVAMCACFTVGAAAQEVKKPITIVVPLAPGGLADAMARYIADNLSKSMSTTVLVDNRPGNTAIGAGLVAHAKPDGTTLLLANAAFVVNQLKEPPPPFDIRTFTAVARIVSVPSIVAVNPSVAAKNMTELVELARSRPGQISYASSGVGSTGNLIGETIKRQTKVDMVHVPYRGSNPAIVAAVAGETNVVMDGGLEQLMPLIAAGRVRPLAITSERRVPALPDLPTLAEAYPAIGAINSWLGLLAPPGTPGEVVKRLNAEINAVVVTEEFASRFLKNGSVLSTGSPTDFQRFIGSDFTRVETLVKSTGMRLGD